ncbi:hypothetical protein Taro_056381 [Colocasia esculenta]|uniref:Uncharacterized protein n=1 Tax=Colocasia esculenta TaxID=4460 RepID=A0A843XX62_COLES|nr:hypothetical protein [Colocasia esculenta]
MAIATMLSRPYNLLRLQPRMITTQFFRFFSWKLHEAELVFGRFGFFLVKEPWPGGCCAMVAACAVATGWCGIWLRWTAVKA